MSLDELNIPETAHRRDQILSAVGFASGVFLRSANWKDALNIAIERLGKAARANRAYYFENHVGESGEILASQLAEWVAPGIESQIDNPNLQSVPYIKAGMGRWLEVMKRRQPIHGLISNFPDSEREILEAQDIRSLVTMPVFSRNELVGFLGFDDCESMRQWSTSEFDALFAAATALGAAIDRHHLETQLRFSQKMDAVGRLASGVAHDFNNMLQAIVNFTNIAKLNAKQGQPVDEELEAILSASNRAHNLTRQLLSFSRKQDLAAQNLNLKDICESVATMIRPTLGNAISLSVAVSNPPPIVLAGPGCIGQVLMNLCLNAIDAMPDGGNLEIKCGQVDPDIDTFKHQARNRRHACIEVRDTGCGMTKQTIDRIFEPFFTTKEVGKGTGLGLSVAYGTINRLDGLIDVVSAPNQGSCFRVYIPLSESAYAKTTAAQSIVSGQETILLVDDEPLVLDSVASLLEVNGHTVITASNGNEGLELYRQHSEKIDVVISDFVMPKMNGAAMIEAIRKLNFDAKAILLSGEFNESRNALTDARNVIVLQKPVPFKSLHEAIHQLMNS